MNEIVVDPVEPTKDSTVEEAGAKTDVRQGVSAADREARGYKRTHLQVVYEVGNGETARNDRDSEQRVLQGAHVLAAAVFILGFLVLRIAGLFTCNVTRMEYLV